MILERKTIAGFRGDESIERTDLAFLHQLADFFLVDFATAHDFVNHENTVLRLEAAQGFDHRLAVGRREDVGHARVGVVLFEIFRALDDTLGDLDDFRHELAARKFAVLHLAQLVFPFARHVRPGERVGVHRGEELEERFRFRRRNELALIPLHVFLINEAVDRVGARRRRAEAALFHRLRHFFVVDEFAGAFHRGEERRFRVARRRLGRLGVQLGGNGFGLCVVFGSERGQGFRVGGIVLDRGLAINGEPAGRGQDLALGLESMPGATVLMRVVTSNSAAGKNAATKRRAIMS